MIAFDPQVNRCKMRRGSTVYTDNEHVDLTNQSSRDYMQWQEDRFDFCTHISLTAQVDPAHMAVLSLHFQREHGERARQLKAAYQTFLPHVANAMKLGFAMSDLLTQSYWEGAQTMIDGRAAFLLSEDALVLHANIAAERLMQEYGGLAYRHGRLICRQTASDQKLQSLIGAALSSTDPQGGLAPLECSADRAPLFAEIFPVNRTRRTMAVSEAAALLVLNSRSDGVPYKMDSLIAAFGLTSAEARIAGHFEVVPEIWTGC